MEILVGLIVSIMVALMLWYMSEKYNNKVLTKGKPIQSNLQKVAICDCGCAEGDKCRCRDGSASDLLWKRKFNLD